MHEWKNDIPTLCSPIFWWNYSQENGLAKSVDEEDSVEPDCEAGMVKETESKEDWEALSREVQALGLQIHYHIDYFRIDKEWMFSNSFKV